MNFALWTRGVVTELIFAFFKVKLTVQSTGNYLLRWGFTPQVPIKRDYKQNSAKVFEFTTTFPKILSDYRKQGFEDWWLDEMQITNRHLLGKGYAPRGFPPLTKYVYGEREKINAITAISSEGRFIYELFEGTCDQDVVIRFLDRLRLDCKSRDNKCLTVLDNLKVHHGKILTEWVQKHKEDIELKYIPAYSPELNPNERGNKDIKYGVATKAPARTLEKLCVAARETLEYLEANPKIILSYFKDKFCKYAARE
jgi:hypothetical protein